MFPSSDILLLHPNPAGWIEHFYQKVLRRLYLHCICVWEEGILLLASALEADEIEQVWIPHFAMRKQEV